MQFKLQDIAELIEGTVEGSSDREINQVAKIEEAGPGSLTFLANPKYTRFIYETAAEAVIVSLDFVPEREIKSSLIRVEDPYAAFAKLLSLYQKILEPEYLREEPQFVHNTATIGDNAYLGAYVYIGRGVKIGKNCKIYPHVHIGALSEIGDNCIIHSGAKIGHQSVIGNDCTIYQNAVIGSDGFGFAPTENGYEAVAQTGNVVLKDRVSIGANTTIDRATLGSTVIGKGVKLDNLIQIAHNVEIGENTVIAAQSGVAGSTKIGKNCMIGGQVGISGHLTIGDNVKIAAQSGIAGSIKSDMIIQGSPAIQASIYNRAYAVFKQLPNLAREIHQLKKK